MTITYRLAFEDYYDAWRAHTAKSWRIRSIAFLSMVILLIGVSVQTDNHHVRHICLLLALICTLAIPAMVGLSTFLFRRAYVKEAGTNSTKQFTVKISEAGMRLDDPPSVADWSSFTKYSESNNAFVLYQANSIAAILPKRAFDSNAIGDLRQLLVAKVRPY